MKINIFTKSNIYHFLGAIILVISSVFNESLAQDSCNRVATINFQEVLVDTSSTNRGEGLKFYLDKDPKSKVLLEKYQKESNPSWKRAAFSTLGSGLMLAGFLRTKEGKEDQLTGRTMLLFSGASLIALSYLVSLTNQVQNEYLLDKAIEEYNTRNTPKIYFTQQATAQGAQGLGIGVQKDF